MSFRFRKKIGIAPGLATNLSKGWPSLSIDGYGATVHVGDRGPGATVGIPGKGMSWQLGGGRHIPKAVQAQADVRAVHAQGTVKAVQAQAEIIAITKRMETVARRFTRNAVGSTRWKKAAVEQAQWLDKMLDVAKTSENDQLIAAVRKCHYAWGDGNPGFRKALDSGLTIVEWLTKALAGGQSGKNVSANWLNDPVATTSSLTESAANNPQQLGVEEGYAGRSIAQRTIWPALWAAVGRNHILPVIGFGVIAVGSTIAVQRLKARPQVIVSATPRLEAPTSIPVIPGPPATPVPERLVTAPTVQVSTPTPPPVQTTPTLSPLQPVIHGKAVHHKHPTPNSTQRQEHHS